jgi:hypothetical protein
VFAAYAATRRRGQSMDPGNPTNRRPAQPERIIAPQRRLGNAAHVQQFGNGPSSLLPSNCPCLLFGPSPTVETHRGTMAAGRAAGVPFRRTRGGSHGIIPFSRLD